MKLREKVKEIERGERGKKEKERDTKYRRKKVRNRKGEDVIMLVNDYTEWKIENNQKYITVPFLADLVGSYKNSLRRVANARESS